MGAAVISLYRAGVDDLRPSEFLLPSHEPRGQEGGVVRGGRNSAYRAKIIKAGALVADTKTLLAHWDEACSVPENLERFQRENAFGKASRSRVEDILAIFRQRYLASESVTKALVTLVKGQFPAEELTRILYFHAAQADALLHDVVAEILLPLHSQGKTDVLIEDIRAPLMHWVDEGRTTTKWSAETTLRVAQGLLATLRDFGVLQGVVHKRLAPMYLPVKAFAYIAFYLHQSQPSGERLLRDPQWRLFFLPPEAVERLFIEAHQSHLLEYYAAGSIIRITFPAKFIEEYTRVLVERAY